MKTPFHQALATLVLQDDRWVGFASECWLQGRSLYGGLQVSFALKAMRSLVPTEIPLRVLQVTFLAPVPAGSLAVAARMLRAGKNTFHVEGRLVDGDQTLAVVVGIFGASRASAVSIVLQRPEVDAPSPIEFGYVPDVTPAFFQHFRMRWLRGGLPFSGAREARAVVEVSLLDQGQFTELHLPAIADLLPPLAFSLLEAPAPGASMTWMLELLQDGFDGLPLEGWRLDSKVLAAAGGYTHQSAILWTPDGRPAALSRQTMVVFG